MNGKNPVMFRKAKDGTLFAIFPTLLGDAGADSCIAYTVENKKISIPVDLVKQTEQASMVESLDLFQEVAAAGFHPMKIVQRIKGYMHIERLSHVKGRPAVAPAKALIKTVIAAKKTHKKRPNRWLMNAA